MKFTVEIEEYEEPSKNPPIFLILALSILLSLYYPQNINQKPPKEKQSEESIYQEEYVDLSKNTPSVNTKVQKKEPLIGPTLYVDSVPSNNCNIFSRYSGNPNVKAPTNFNNIYTVQTHLPYNLCVRSKPYFNSPPVTSVAPGTTLYSGDKSYGNWIYIQTDTGEQGWVSMSFVDINTK